MRYFLGLILSCCLAFPGFAQSDEPIFDSYETLRATLDGHIMRREIADVMRAFGGSDEMTEQELAALEGRVQALFPENFTNVDVLKVDEMGAGWRQELYAYWGGIRYLYAYVLLHDRGDSVVSVHFRFNTEFDVLNANF